MDATHVVFIAVELFFEPFILHLLLKLITLQEIAW